MQNVGHPGKERERLAEPDAVGMPKRGCSGIHHMHGECRMPAEQTRTQLVAPAHTPHNLRMQASFRPPPPPSDVIARLDRLESLERIRQLACRYALALDVRDLDAVVGLYVDDVRVGSHRGRPALRAVFDRVMRGFTTTSHQVQNHVIEFDHEDHAQGLVTCRCEHEVASASAGPRWVVLQNLYHDRYERRDGHWYFRARVQNRLYATAFEDPPVGPLKDRWPDQAPAATPFHEPFDVWREFWGEQAPAADLPPWSRDQNFIHRLRRSPKLPALAGHIARATDEASASPPAGPPS